MYNAGSRKDGESMQQACPSVSVLVPIYNVERYLPQCLEALCSQSCATGDRGRQRRVDRRITVCFAGMGAEGRAHRHRRQAEFGVRRFYELRHRGRTRRVHRIVEPDDFPERDMFKRLLRMAQRHDCDLVKCNFFEHYEDHDDRIRNFADFPYGRLFDPVEQPRIVCTIPAIWTGLYRKAWLDDEGIRFRETPGASFQDTSFVMKSWFAARRCALVRKPLLHYRMDNPGSR